MRVLVTGARGFLGPHVVEALQAAGHDVAAVGREDGDLAESGLAERLLAVHAPAAVVHLAAAVGKPDTAATVRDNVVATALVAEACARAGARVVLGSTTSAVDGAGLYALSKRWSEEAASHFRPDATVLRFHFPYGPGGSAATAMLERALRGERVPVHRGSVRSWCWVGDAARAAVLLLEAATPGAFDVGRDDDPRTLRETAELACRVAGADPALIEEVEPPGGPTRPRPLDTRGLRELGWRPEVELEEGLRLTLDGLASARA